MAVLVGQTMLVALEISDLILIDTLSLNFDQGLCAFTGETGTGKSILLNSLALALGTRGSANLVRPGSKTKNATVTATFDLDTKFKTKELFLQSGLALPETGEYLVLRRTIDTDGRSRAYVNDTAVTIGFLKELGEHLIQIEGQFAAQGLLNTTNHKATLDCFANSEILCSRVSEAYQQWTEIEDKYQLAKAARSEAKAEEDFTRFALEELKKLNPEPGEEEQLAETRNTLINNEKIIQALSSANSILSGDPTPDQQINFAIRALSRQTNTLGDRFNGILEKLNMASEQLQEAEFEINNFLTTSEVSPSHLEACEERLFRLRAMARKHSVTVDQLPDVLHQLENKLDLIADDTGHLQNLKNQVISSKKKFQNLAKELHNVREKFAKKLDKAVNSEFEPLRLEKTKLVTVIEELGEDHWGPSGLDSVRFEVSTNPGTEPGPLGKIASGGELARILLAIKVALQNSDGIPTIVFDEVDSGIGGATAAAVGKRLAKLSKDTQIIVVTHSPQVASYAKCHIKIEKSGTNNNMTTKATPLTEEGRRKEIARMLSGSKLTKEALAAADSLLNP
ncbi:MAG: DNA repair protein RecN [Alphaproteobacteria bacterium]